MCRGVLTRARLHADACCRADLELVAQHASISQMQMCLHAASGEVPAREGVLRLMDEARAAGLLVGVCSAATKSSAVCVVESLLGKDRYEVRYAPLPELRLDGSLRVPRLFRGGARHFQIHCPACSLGCTIHRVWF